MSIPPTLHFIPFSDQSAVNLSGATRSMLTLCTELAKRGRVAIVPFQEGFVAEYCRGHGIEPYPVFQVDGALPHSAVRVPGTMLGIRRAARRFGAELIHVHSAPGCKYAWPAAATLGLPLVSHQRDIYAPNRFHRGLGLAKRIVAISHWIYSTLPPTFAARASVVHNAVLMPEGVDVASRAEGELLRVGFAGRFSSDKGPDLLLEAAETLLPAGEAMEFHFWGVPDAGAGDAFGRGVRARLEALGAAHPGRVHIQPFRKDVEAFYRSMHTVVVPSRFAEPFGRVAIEGMAYGRVVVVADHGGLPEIVQDGQTGVLFSHGDSASLADRLRALAADEARRGRIARDGLEHVRTNFDASEHADAVLKIYDEVLGRS